MDEPVVEEGPLTQVPAADATALEWLAHGEFVGPRGELASYALGWASGQDPRRGRLTVGIGAGNPGGGTFHAELFDNDGELAFTLVDTVLTEVPEGGPHLTADEARAHEDIAFVWFVADQVMVRDGRAAWMAHFVSGTRCITTPEVFELQEPVLLVVNDADDELWQLIGTADGGEDARIVHLFHAVDEDPTLLEILDLEPGEQATRERVGGAWTRGPESG